MRQFLIGFLALLFIAPVSLFSQNTLTIHQKNGITFSIGLNELPVVSFSETHLILTTSRGTKVEYPLKKLLNFTFDTKNNPRPTEEDEISESNIINNTHPTQVDETPEDDIINNTHPTEVDETPEDDIINNTHPTEEDEIPEDDIINNPLPTDVDEISEDDIKKPELSLEEYLVSIIDAKSDIAVNLMASDGKLINTYKTDQNGSVTFGIAQLPNGTYIISLEDLTIKITKR